MATPDLTSPAPPAKKRIRRVLRRVGVFLLVLYAGLCLVLYAMQTKLMFPGAASQGLADSRVTAPPGTELVTMKTAPGETVAALYGPAMDEKGRALPADAARHRPTLIWFYGNGMCLADSLPELEDFRRMGMNVLIPEYVGYGMSTGRPGERECYDTADAAWTYVMSRPETNRTKIAVGGWSLGGAVAIDLASRHPGEVSRLMVFSAFTSAPDVGARFYPYLPVRMLMAFRFESIDKIGKIDCPILIGHGRHDEIVPFDMSETLAAKARAAGREATTFAVDQAGHNDFFATGGTDVKIRVWEFIKGLSGGDNPTK